VISVVLKQTVGVVKFVMTKWYFCDVLFAAVDCIAQIIRE